MLSIDSSKKGVEQVRVQCITFRKHPETQDNYSNISQEQNTLQ